MITDNIFKHIRSSTRTQFLLIWIAIFFFLFIQGLWMGTKIALATATSSTINMIIVSAVVFYVLIPKLLLQQKKILYILTSLTFVIGMIILCSKIEIRVFNALEIEMDHRGPKEAPSFLKYTFLFILVYTVSNITFFVRKISEDARQKQQLIADKKVLEMKVLKSQINSHFLFNALNNIYSMIYFKDEYTSGYVLKLSQMMRYIMEDCEAELTSLAKEIEYIENYIDFQKLRFENDKDIRFVHNVPEKTHIRVPPMLFQPFVENCFKHSPLQVEKESYIHISLQMDGTQIRFTAENSQPMIKHTRGKYSTGIGLENVKRRLAIQYRNNYELNIEDKPEYFKIELIATI